VFIEEEGSREALRDRLAPFLGDDASGARLDIAWRKGVRLDDPASLSRLITACKGAALVVLDPLVELHGADENEQKEMGAVIRGINRLLSETGAAVVILHHTKKGDSWDPGKKGSALSSDARGSGVLVGAVDTVFSVKSVPPSQRVPGELRFVVENPDTRIGEPVPRRLAAVKLTGGVGSLEWLEDPDRPQTGGELQERLVAALSPDPAHALPPKPLREMLHVKMDRLEAAITLGFRDRRIAAGLRGGLYRVGDPGGDRGGVTQTRYPGQNPAGNGGNAGVTPLPCTPPLGGAGDAGNGPTPDRSTYLPNCAPDPDDDDRVAP